METYEIATERKLNVLVLGAEKKNLAAPGESIKTRNFEIFFEKYQSHRRLQEFDGVVVFQGIFENFEHGSSFSGSYTIHRSDTDELDKRKKEAHLLLAKGGFICFLVTDPFEDVVNSKTIRDSDLAKFYSNYAKLSRRNLGKRMTSITPVVSEFKRFFELYGAASVYFENFDDSLDMRVLARVGSANVGISLLQNIYFLPSLIPDSRPKVIAEYFEYLVDALTAVHNKNHQTVPAWIGAYQFDEEIKLASERESAARKIVEVDSRLDQLTQFKAALFHTGDNLVKDVRAVFEGPLGQTIDVNDEFREDFKLLSPAGKVLALGEIKGVNAGITREHVNQADSHRVRSGFPDGFPTLLIVNSGIKSSRTIAEKAKNVPAREQIAHAVYMRVLILRTIDLLDLLRLILAGKLSQTSAVEAILTSVGWLRIEGETMRIENGT